MATFKNSVSYFMQLATDKKTLYRAIFLSVLIGIIINLLNNPKGFAFDLENGLNYIKVIFSIFISFSILLVSSVLLKTSLKPGNVSHIDALLQCNSCKRTDFHVHVGQELEQCPTCKKKTRWTPKEIFSIAKSDNEVLKSLALFARHNPQPLFRVDANGIINGSNPASEKLFEESSLAGQNIKSLLPELLQFDFNRIIKNDEVAEILISVKNNFYNLVLKGVNSINTINIYGNDITQIKLAEQKIQSQAKDIKESIGYAWSIQKAMLPHEEFIEKVIPSHFIFYRPRNIVSGDFYWINTINNYKIVIAADSTGHGVPGAFMSMLGISILNELILREKIVEPDIILNQLRKRIIESLETGKYERTIQDGMDIAVAVINPENNTLKYAGAFNPLLILRNEEIKTLIADEMPVGKYFNDTTPFSVQSADLQPGDRIYLFTDGYKDQFGGERDKKFGMKSFSKLLVESGNLSTEKQLETIENTFDTWKNGYEQIDDVLVIGVEI
jgi:serine phosphatase RsbU (regulator of sigma subunit)